MISTRSPKIVLRVGSLILGVLLAAESTRAAIVTWDASGANPAAPTDGSGNWNTTTGANWSDGATDAAWITGNTATIGANNGAAGTITIDDASGTVSVAGINFNAPGSGSYTIAPAAAETLTLTTPTVNVAAGVTPTINAPIAGGAGLTVVASGNTASLTLGGINTYTGNTTIDGGGTLRYATTNTTGGTLIFGVATAMPFSTTPSALDLTSADLTAANLDVRTNSSTANNVTLASGRTLTINNTSTTSTFIGANFSGQVSDNGRTVLNVTGAGGSVVINHSGAGAHLVVGRQRLNADATGDPAATFDLSGTSNFTESNLTGNGELRIGAAGNIAGTMRLANTPADAVTGPTNSITVNQLRIGDTGAAGGDNNNGGNSTLSLGSGTVAAPATNLIQADTINVGTVKGSGLINFQGAAGSVTISGKAGINSNANITMANYSSATGSNTASSIQLAGHMATVKAGTVSLARAANGTGGIPNGTITFDTGTFDVATSLQIVGQSGSNNITNGVTGTFVLGGPTADSSATGVLTVNGQFLMINRNQAASTTPMNATFTLNGGTANINTNIGISDTGPAATRNPVINLQGGTLNLNGNSIGTAALPIPVNARSGTLQNLTELNGGGTLTKSNPGTLKLAGTNTYTGATAINAGTFLVNGSHTGGATYTVASGATLGGSGTTNAPVIIDGILAPGNTPGTLTINNSVTLNPASKLAMDLDGGNPGIGGSGNDLLTGVTALTLDGVLDISESVAGSFLLASEGDRWRLITYTGGLTDDEMLIGMKPDLQPGLLFEIDTSTLGQVDLVVTVPEANAVIAIGLFGMSAAVVVFVRKRRALTAPACVESRR